MTFRNPLNSGHDFENYYDGNKLANLRKMRHTVRLAKEYDIIHVHAGIPRNRLDYVYISKMVGKLIVVHYHGTEVRTGYGLHYPRVPNARIVSTPDLLKWLPDAHFLPNPLAAGEISFDKSKKVTVLHMPSNRKFKGTDLILKAIEGLKKEGYFSSS